MCEPKPPSRPAAPRSGLPARPAFAPPAPTTVFELLPAPEQAESPPNTTKNQGNVRIMVLMPNPWAPDKEKAPQTRTPDPRADLRSTPSESTPAPYPSRQPRPRPPCRRPDTQQARH